MRDLLLFRIGRSRFAAPLATVEETLDLSPDAVQDVPGERVSLRGVFALRGGLVPLYDPPAALGARLDAGGTVMVVRPAAGGSRVGLFVDDVEDVLENVPDADVRPPTGAADSDGIVRGVLHRAGSIIVVVDLNALVAACRSTDRGDRP